jgi:hypothetical protein
VALTYFQRSTAASNVGTPPGTVLASREASTTAGGASSDIATGNISAGASTNVYFFTDDPAPGADGATGDYSVVLRFSTGNAQIQASVALARVDSSGAQQTTTALSAEQASNAGPLTFGFTAENLGTWAAGDRLRVRVQLRNQHSMNQSCTLAVNTSDDTIDTPFSSGSTDATPEPAAITTAATLPQTGVNVTASPATVAATVALPAATADAGGGGGGTAAFVDSAGTGSDALVSSRSVAVPGTVADDDVVVCVLARWDGGSSFPAVTAPADAVLRGTVTIIEHQSLVYLIRISGHSSLAFSWTGSRWSTLQVLFFTGVDTGLDLSAAPFDPGTGTGTAVATRTVTTVDGAALAFHVNTQSYGEATTHEPPTDFTEEIDETPLTSAYRISPGDGSQSAAGATISVSQDWSAALVALAPGAGGGDATATPAVIAATVALPQATPQTAGNATVSPATIAAVASAPQPAANSTVTATTVTAVVDMPDWAINTAAVPDTAPATVALPAPTVQTAGNATAAPAAITGTAALPQPAANVGAGPATITAAVSLPSVAADVTAGPAVTPVIAALPAPTVQAGGNSTVTPDAVAALTALPQSAVNIGAGPALVPLTAALPAATAAVSDSVAPAVIAAVVTLPPPTVQAGGNVTVAPAVIAGLIALPRAGINTLLTPGVIQAVVSLPLATAGSFALVAPAVIAAAATIPRASIAAVVTPGGITVLVVMPLASALGSLPDPHPYRLTYRQQTRLTYRETSTLVYREAQ